MRGSFRQRSWVQDVLYVLLIVAACRVWSAHIQAPIEMELIDSHEYRKLEGQFRRDEPLQGEKPFAYRVAVPFMVSVLSADGENGFRQINTWSGVVTAILLSLWLRQFIRLRAARWFVITLFVTVWLGPIRFVDFNPVYVDPLFQAFACAGLLISHRLRERPSRAWLAGMCLVCALGTLVRETMLLVPIAFCFANNPLGSARDRRETERRALSMFALVVPLVIAIATIAWTHVIVDSDGQRTFVGAALQWIRKPPTSYVLAWLTTFGPVLALPIADWRFVATFLRSHQDMAAFLAGCAALAYFGGADTERFVSWSSPVVYLLIALVLERQWNIVSKPAVAIPLICCQAVSARIFWSIPGSATSPSELATAPTAMHWLYGVADRLFVIEHFYWNLYASFGSAPFRFARLTLYLAVTAAFVLYLRRRDFASPHPSGRASGPGVS